MTNRTIKKHQDNFILIQNRTGLKANRAHHFYYMSRLSIEMNYVIEMAIEIINKNQNKDE